MSKLEIYLRRFRRRYRLQIGWQTLQRSLWIAALLCLLVQLFGRFYPIPHLVSYITIPWLIWLPLVISYSLFRPLSLMQAAGKVDETLDLKERLSSSLSFQSGPSNFNPVLVKRQREDALVFAAKVNPSQAFPLHWLIRPIAAGVGLLCLILVFLFLPNPMDRVIQERLTIKESVREQAKAIAELSQQISKDETISPEKQEQLRRLLDELSASLKDNPGDLDQALAELSQLEQQLKSRLDPGQNTQQAFLDALANRLAQLSSTQASADSAAAAEAALEQLVDRLDELDQAELDQLARELAQLSAQASQAGSSQISQSLSALAQAVQSSDLQSAGQAVEAAKASLQQLNQSLIDQQAIQGVLAQAQSSQQALAQTGRQLAQGQGQTPGQNPGSIPGQGQSPGAGGGTKANQLPPFQGGKTNLPSPRGNAPSTQTGQLNDQVYAPWQRSLTNGEQLFIPGQDSGKGQTSTSESEGSQPGVANPALTPYQQVLPQYLNSANQAMQQSTIPAGLLDYVRLYFSSLGAP